MCTVGTCYANSMNQQELVKKILREYPSISFEKSDTYYWSPKNQTVYYNTENNTSEGLWALLHETGHALLEHLQYYSDVELVLMEVSAWEKAKELAEQQDFEIDEDHVQDCLDSYRDWLHKRSLCPDCSLAGVQTDTQTYACIFCHKNWKVSAERFCRPYRKSAL